MKTNGQRQDIAFLALAVAVLAVAVALFVAMRSIEKGRQNEPEPEPAQVVEVAEPVVEEPAEPAKGRDPFRAQAGSAAGAGAGAGPAAQSHALKLVGIVMEQGDKPMAIIHSATKRYYARVGDRAAGYTVVDIGTNSATLDKDGDRITLVLRQPEPEE